MTDESDIVGRIERLRDDPAFTFPSFQGVLGAALMQLEEVRRAEEQAALAAISLGQRESVGALLAETTVTVDALRALATRPPETMRPSSSGVAGSWWFALAESTQTIETTIDRLSYMVSAQPKGSAVRSLVTEVLRVLRGHHSLLMGEATRWIEG